jgi:soluble lytic murein transglycosylase-like protein
MKMTTESLVNTALVLLGYAWLAGGCSSLQAQKGSPPAQPTAEKNAVAAQQAAVAAMQESIARQRASVEKQSGQTADTFFLLPPPAHMEGVEPGAATAECAPLPDGEVRTLAGNAATREGLDAEMLLNVMRQESGFRPCAVSPKGAMGLMQLMPSTADQLGVKDSFDPLENVDAGARFLRQLLTRYNGDVLKAVSAYNAGPARVDAVDGIPQIPETIDYINRIFYPGFEKQ